MRKKTFVAGLAVAALVAGGVGTALAALSQSNPETVNTLYDSWVVLSNGGSVSFAYAVCEH